MSASFAQKREELKEKWSHVNDPKFARKPWSYHHYVEAEEAAALQTDLTGDSSLLNSTAVEGDDLGLSGYVQDNFDFLDQMDCSVLDHMEQHSSYQVCSSSSRQLKFQQELNTSHLLWEGRSSKFMCVIFWYFEKAKREIKWLHFILQPPEYLFLCCFF